MEFDQIAVHADFDFNMKKLFGGGEWVDDTVTAKGVIFPNNSEKGVAIRNVAQLFFNYTIIPGKEFELLRYIDGPNFLSYKLSGSLSHFGSHVDAIDDWRNYMHNKGFRLEQEVITVKHTNVPAYRHYHYAIYSHPLQNFFWKLIERLDDTNYEAEMEAMERRYDCAIF